jgi:hypothetical protein
VFGAGRRSNPGRASRFCGWFETGSEGTFPLGLAPIGNVADRRQFVTFWRARGFRSSKFNFQVSCSSVRQIPNQTNDSCLDRDYTLNCPRGHRARHARTGPGSGAGPLVSAGKKIDGERAEKFNLPGCRAI